MRRVQFLAVFLTLALATPLTFLALFATAYLTDNQIKITNAVVFFFQSLGFKGRDLLIEAEIFGLILGALVIYVIMQGTLLRNNQKKL